MERFVNKTYKENSGGRPVEKYIDTEISEKISEEILFGKLVNGGKIIVDTKDDNINLVYN